MPKKFSPLEVPANLTNNSKELERYLKLVHAAVEEIQEYLQKQRVVTEVCGPDDFAIDPGEAEIQQSTQSDRVRFNQNNGGSRCYCPAPVGALVDEITIEGRNPSASVRQMTVKLRHELAEGSVNTVGGAGIETIYDWGSTDTTADAQWQLKFSKSVSTRAPLKIAGDKLYFIEFADDSSSGEAYAYSVKWKWREDIA